MLRQNVIAVGLLMSALALEVIPASESQEEKQGVTARAPAQKGKGVIGDRAPCERIADPGKNGLIGRQGKKEEQYWFSFLADYDDLGRKRKIVFALRNNHDPNNGPVLPAGWKEAGFPFRRFTACRANSLETTLPVVEQAGNVKYGPAAQHSRVANIYASKDPQKTSQQGMELRSRITTSGKDGDFDFRFTTEVRAPRVFVYQAWSGGARPKQVYFRIPELDNFWVAIQKEHNIHPTETWVRGKKQTFVAPAYPDMSEKEPGSPKDKGKFAFRVRWPNENVRIVERTVSVELLARPDGEIIEGGKVTVYLASVSK